MPCDTIRTIAVNLGTMNRDILVAGLKAAGYAVQLEGDTMYFQAKGSYYTHRYRDGELDIQGSVNPEQVVGALKQAYSAECVRKAMGRDWRLKESKSEKGVAFQVTSRR